jgi:hypothetical protein
VKDIHDMTDEQWRLHQARHFAAGMYRTEGHEWFARRVEAGLEDTCNPVRLGKFFQNLPDTSGQPERCSV